LRKRAEREIQSSAAVSSCTRPSWQGLEGRKKAEGRNPVWVRFFSSVSGERMLGLEKRGFGQFLSVFICVHRWWSWCGLEFRRAPAGAAGSSSAWCFAEVTRPGTCSSGSRSSSDSLKCRARGNWGGRGGTPSAPRPPLLPAKAGRGQPPRPADADCAKGWRAGVGAAASGGGRSAPVSAADWEAFPLPGHIRHLSYRQTAADRVNYW